MSPELFKDRADAGRVLAAALAGRDDIDIVFAIPRGGAVVAKEVANALQRPMDLVVPRKLGAPGDPELAIGAVSGWGEDNVIDSRIVSYLHISQAYIEAESARQIDEARRRLRAYRGTEDPPNLTGKVIVMVDDGVATGHTTRAAARSLKTAGARRIILAVPVGAPDSLAALRGDVDEIICLKQPTSFSAVGFWYQDFHQTTDEEVIEIIRHCG